MTTNAIIKAKALKAASKFGRQGERTAFALGYMVGKLTLSRGIDYKVGGRCYYAFMSGKEWGEAEKREMERDAIIRAISKGK